MAKKTLKRTRVDDSSSDSSEEETVNFDDMSLAQLKEALRDSQLKKNQAEKKMRQALGDITNTSDEENKHRKSKSKGNDAKRRKKRRRVGVRVLDDDSDAEKEGESGSEDGTGSGSEESHTDSDDDARDVVADVASLGRRALKKEIDETYDAKKRFDSKQGIVQGQLRDLFDILPNHLDGKTRQKGWFRRAFLDGMSSQLSNTSTRVRRGAGDSIFKCSSADLLSPASRRQFREKIGWHELGDGESGEGDARARGEYASLDVPILHQGGSKEYDIHTCFLNPVLMRLFAAIVCGPNAAAAMREAEDNGTDIASIAVPVTDNMERIHQISCTEPGAIAAASVLAIWGKSTDIKLQARGDHTNIDYEGRFNEYLEILTTGLHKKSPSILHVFAEWDRQLRGAGRNHGRKKSDGFSRAMEALAAEEESLEGEGESAEGEGNGGGGGGGDENGADSDSDSD
ncbi:hypothetical protein R3P38DRAFT_3453557 [Favolaschia claudopus]|uniref:Uncharacterized protein n=1 Tax=Favolaschia claudopus TaxID=2862362 RepID=A0AAW0CTF1_9AGAR